MTSQFKLRLLKTGLAIGTVVTPTRVMNYLWDKLFTIRKRALKPPHQKILEDAETGTLEVTLFDENKQQIVTYVWGQGDKTVLLLHGWESKAADYYKLIPRLLEEGYRVLSLDFPAHGNSSGNQTSLPEFIKTVTQYFNQSQRVDAIVAHSLGGTAAFTWLLEQKDLKNALDVQKLILIGSPIVPVNFFEGAFNFLGIHRRIRNRFYQKAKRKFGKGIEDFALPVLESTNFQEKVVGLYDHSDKVVNIKEAKLYHQQNPNLSMRYFQDIGHHQMIKNKEIIASCMAILLEVNHPQETS